MVKVIDQSCCFMKLFKNLRHCLKSIRKTFRHSFDSTMCRLSSPQPNIQVNSLTAALPFSNFISSSKKFITKSLLSTLVDSNSISIELKRFEAIEVLSLLILTSSMPCWLNCYKNRTDGKLSAKLFFTFIIERISLDGKIILCLFCARKCNEAMMSQYRLRS